jgi:hypothetical protein
MTAARVIYQRLFNTSLGKIVVIMLGQDKNAIIN